MWHTIFWVSALERAVKTFAQALVGILASDHVGLFDVSWGSALSSAGLAALLSVLTSIASERITEQGTPSLVRTEPDEEPSVPVPLTALYPQTPYPDQPQAQQPGPSYPQASYPQPTHPAYPAYPPPYPPDRQPPGTFPGSESGPPGGMPLN
ncbi:holin [Streptomyces sp. YIM 121038]|uniref:holin n=1 Tax=Streptomyces sp. YIM 121038 TaxID=2136401 RepID=UPI00111009B6|nr:holin [Streptomyces sp. YIM 121038]